MDDVQRLYIVLRPESGERPIEEKQARIPARKAPRSRVRKEQVTARLVGRGRLERREAKAEAAMVAQVRLVRREVKVAMVARYVA